MAEPLEIGDRVQLLDEALEGYVTALRPGCAVVQTTDGFTLELDPSSLVRLPEQAGSELTVRPEDRVEKEKTQGPKKRHPRPRRRQRQTPPMEVDLHAEKLLPNPRKRSTYEILEFQLDTAQRQLEFAMRKRIQRVVFIHGVGEGVLRAELRALFRRYDDLRYGDADPRKYGRGATEVYIPQTAFR